MTKVIARKTLHRLIGERFEDIFHRQFPDFKKTTDDDGKPDFFNGKIWVEAKVGFKDFGVRLKPRQIRSFRRISDQPVLYVVGYHNFENAIQRLRGLNQIDARDVLKKEMDIARAYIVSEDVIRSIYRGESRTAPISGITYAMLKERFLRAIIENKSFTRNRKDFTPSAYYHIQRSDLFLSSAPHFIESSKRTSYGLVVNKKDERTRDFLYESGLFRV